VNINSLILRLFNACFESYPKDFINNSDSGDAAINLMGGPSISLLKKTTE